MRRMGLMGLMGLMIALAGCGAQQTGEGKKAAAGEGKKAAAGAAAATGRISDYQWKTAIEVIRETHDPIRADLEKTLDRMATILKRRPDEIGHVDIMLGMVADAELILAWKHVPPAAKETAMSQELLALIEESRQRGTVPSAICREYVERRLKQIRPEYGKKK